MMKHWADQLALFNDAPVVDFSGVIAPPGVGGWGILEYKQKWPPEPDALGCISIPFDVWRVDEGEIQTRRIHMMGLISYEKWNSLTGHAYGLLHAFSIIHLKAKVAQNSAGFQQALFVEWVDTTTSDVELNELRRQLMEPVTLDLFPLPLLHMSPSDGSWSGMIDLPSWEDCFLQSEPDYGKRGFSTVPGTPFSMDSTVSPPDERLGYRGVPPTPEQVAAYVYLTANDKTVQNAILQDIFNQYPDWQRDYGSDEEFIPDVNSPEDLRSLIILWDLSIRSDSKEGCSYVYFNLIPNWDIEHGLAAIMQRDRVVAVGDHDSMWNAIEEDSKSS